MLQNWAEIEPTIYGNPKLSSKARIVAAKMTKLRELVDPSDDFFVGKNSGDTVGYRTVGRITRDATTPIGESDPVPFTKPPVYHGTGTVYRYAQAVAWTGELEDLDRLDVQDYTVHALTEHYARTEDELIYDELVTGRSFTYVPTASTTGAFRDDGTFVATAAAPLTLWHLRNLTKELIKKNTPYADGSNWLTVLSPTAKMDILQDTGNQGWTDVAKYSASGAEGALKNEIGSVAQHRIIEENATLDDGIGTGSAYGSGFVTGYEAIRELTVYPVHFRYNGNLGGDFANQKGICWQVLFGFKTPWSYSAMEQGSVCHIGSSGL